MSQRRSDRQPLARDERKQPKTERVRAHALDSGLLFATLLLCVIGLIALFSASYPTGLYRFGSSTYFIFRQVIFAALGIGAMIVVSKIKYTIYARFYKPLLIGSLLLLVLVLTPLGTSRNQAQRWIFGFQPSETAKLAVIICFAYWITKRPNSIKSLKGMAYPYGALLLVIAGLLLKEPHTSATIIVLGIGVVMLFVGGMRLWYFIPVGVAGSALAVIFYLTVPHVRTRIEVWLDPFLDMRDKGFQGSMSQIAIGSGGFFGLGLGQGRQKHLYLPEPQNDFIFSSWCEEMGLIGALVVIAIFVYLIYRGFKIAQAAPDKFSSLLAVGITVKVAIQTLMNLCVVSGIIPVTGAALPFFSYGGTALVLQLFEIGILLNISRYMRIDEKQKG